MRRIIGLERFSIGLLHPPIRFVGLARITPTPTRPHRGGGSTLSGTPPGWARVWEGVNTAMQCVVGDQSSPRHTNMNPEMAYFIRPCSLPQDPAFPALQGRETRREWDSQAFDIARFLGDDRHRGGSTTEFSPCSQGAELGGAAADGGE